jgi:DNA repair exonuclease SbcCD ATPase subunit
MRAAVLIVLLSCVCASAVKLPPGFNSAGDLATVLANEPDAARFASASYGSDSITFKDDAPAASSGGAKSTGDDESDADVAEFDSQIEAIVGDIKKIKEAVKESEECAKRVAEQQAELRGLIEQKEHLEKEKEKKILQTKLEKQMKDLGEINRMSRALRTKFSELKHTQKLIKTKMAGTRSSLGQLDSDTEPLSDSQLNEAAENIGAELDAMHKAQGDVLSKAHKTNAGHVRGVVQTANKMYKKKGQDVKEDY